jgi:photosystem II stability/assembly factor-like uncharacterized protein
MDSLHMKKATFLILTVLLAACGTDRTKTQTNAVTSTVIETGISIESSVDTPAPTSVDVHPTAVSPSTPTSLPAPTTDESFTLTTLYMMDAITGWGIESTNDVVRSTDGGATWQDVTPPQGGIFAFLDATHAWATLNASDSCDRLPLSWDEYQNCMPGPEVVIWRTEDGGQTWQPSNRVATGESHYKPIAIQFVNLNTGWFLFVDSFGPMGAMSMGLLRTDDGGVLWKLVKFPLEFCIHRGMVFTNQNDGWSGGDCRFTPTVGISLGDFLNGKLAPELDHTSDGSRSWDSDSLPPPRVFPTELTHPSIDPNLHILCGVTRMDRISQQAFTFEWTCSHEENVPSSLGEFSYKYLTSDGGQTWTSWLSTGNEDFVNAVTGWRLLSPGDGRASQLQKTADGGSSWITLSDATWQSAQFDFVSEKVGWAIVTDDDVTALLHTIDGGNTWVDIDLSAFQ